MVVLTLVAGPEAADAFLGTVLCQSVSRNPTSKGLRLRKGQVIGADELGVLRSVEPQLVRVVHLENDDVHEDEAGRRLAAAVAGPGLKIEGPIQSRMNLVATTRGIAVINVPALTEINLVPDVSVFTVLPYQPVSSGDLVAGAKIVPMVISRASVAMVERIAAAEWPVIQVKPFAPLKVGVVSTHRQAPPRQARFENALQRKLDWFRARLGLIRYVEPDPEAAKRGYQDVLRDEAELIVTAGSRSADPIDPLIVAIQELGGTIETRGTPAHPGSFFWLGYHGSCPIFGLPSCGAYSETTVVDILLPRALAGERLTRRHIAELGAGGLFGRGMNARFPQYGIEPDPSPTPD